uniref:LRRCT domain-containing protein n=1 Tax=Syphacia muris TaxID=451379 RepID=A0A0N5AVX7_9BILA
MSIRNNLRFFQVLLILLAFLLEYYAAYGTEVLSCTEINDVFTKVAKENDLAFPACQCYYNPEFFPDYLSSQVSTPSPWIGCGRQKMPHVFKTLSALNKTEISKLWIWDSLINIVPAKMFLQVRPITLSIQHSGVSVFRPSAFEKIGSNLKVLELRHNLLKSFEPLMSDHLRNLSVLDLAENKISKVFIGKGQLAFFPELETLVLNDNRLSLIEDGAFDCLKNLRILNLAGNNLTSVKSEMFDGLESLEELYLQNNNFVNFRLTNRMPLRNLKILNLESNKLSVIVLERMAMLEKLVLSKNNIASIKDVEVVDNCNLKMLTLDHNTIKQIRQVDLAQLQQCKSLEVLSVAGNMVKYIEPNAFKPLNNLKILSLDNNEITAISTLSNITTGNCSFLYPLTVLENLYLSNNEITKISKNDLITLKSLKVLDLDSNQIQEVSPEALRNLSLSSLYLANNRLSNLPKGLFDSAAMYIERIDLSGNPWHCISNEKWLPLWAEKIIDHTLRSSLVGCIKSVEKSEAHNSMITVIAGGLAVVSLLSLFAIAFLYFEDGRRMKHVPSDLLLLVSDVDDARQPLNDETTTEKDTSLSSNTAKKRVTFDGV